MAACEDDMTATIIVAATQSMGMSYKEHLPWPRLERENGYFEATTRRRTVPETMNAVIMGYNTWDHVPTKRYPGRINVVVARNPGTITSRLRGDTRKEPLHAASSIEHAMKVLLETYPCATPSSSDSSLDHDKPPLALGRVFIIGGAGLCREALRLPWVDRLLLTRVGADFEADTYFPFYIDGRGNPEWERRKGGEFREWAGPDTPVGMQTERGIEWEAYMFTRGKAAQSCCNGGGTI
ncbi:Dihydrofolate reductase [Metarhizium rileyi]|uniref:Dihydrofolate reductase n=1 Tax=Metarhizium rileyi (strain RCEF 4871) TaxID=1649241 RepID=A0A167AXD3_METRR|nr:Dihydrofolate reductase [Metarhizium rileyi RCEF 4871]